MEVGMEQFLIVIVVRPFVEIPCILTILSYYLDEYATVFQNPVVIFIISLMTILMLLVMPTLLSIITFQVRIKSKIRNQLKEAQRHTGIYEEIDKPYASINITAPQIPPILDYARNIAYVHMTGADHKDQLQLEPQSESKQPIAEND